MKARVEGVAVAVSGGSDSLALCVMLQRWYDQQRRDSGLDVLDLPPLRSITVNHNLRPEAAAEAEGVRTFLTARGFSHTTVSLAFPKGGQAEGVEMKQEEEEEDEGHHGDGDDKAKVGQGTSRRARYDILTDTCLELGVRNLLVAHHLEDQCETFLQRLIKASDLVGLRCTPKQRIMVRGMG